MAADFLALLRMFNIRAIAASLGLPETTWLIAAVVSVALIASAPLLCLCRVVPRPLFIRVALIPAGPGLSPLGYLLLMTESASTCLRAPRPSSR